MATRFRDPAQNLLPEQATQNITYDYTESGKRHTMGTPTRTYTYGYDTYGRWNSITNAQTGTTTCTLRWDGRVTQQQLGNGATTDYTWTVLQGRLVKQTNTRTNNGQPAQSKFTNFVYDWKHQLTSYAADIEGVLQNNTSFTYDEKTGELLTDANTDTKAYKYDQRGNILHQPNHELNGYIDTDRFTRAYNQKNQWIGYTDKQDDDQVVYNRKDNSLTGDPLFAYDANGNPTTYKGISASYDPDNNLTSYGDMLTAGYRSDGLRAWKQNADGVRTYFLYDGDKLVCELQLTGTEGNYGLVVSASTTWGPNGLADRYTNATGTKVYYQCDPLGNVIQRLDINNNVISTSSYDSYGNTNITAMGGDPFGYKGKFGYYTDVETGLILCLHRYYDPATGRWLTRDPIGYAGGLNLYAYCGNAPVGGVDASGLKWDEIISIFKQTSDVCPKEAGDVNSFWIHAYVNDNTGDIEFDVLTRSKTWTPYKMQLQGNTIKGPHYWAFVGQGDYVGNINNTGGTTTDWLDDVLIEYQDKINEAAQEAQYEAEMAAVSARLKAASTIVPPLKPADPPEAPHTILFSNASGKEIPPNTWITPDMSYIPNASKAGKIIIWEDADFYYDAATLVVGNGTQFYFRDGSTSFSLGVNSPGLSVGMGAGHIYKLDDDVKFQLVTGMPPSDVQDLLNGASVASTVTAIVTEGTVFRNGDYYIVMTGIGLSLKGFGGQLTNTWKTSGPIYLPHGTPIRSEDGIRTYRVP